ncbi:hypothetical protein Tco_1101738 [Tanacetum coccineum]
MIHRWRIQAEANDEVEKLMSTEIVPSQHVSDKAYLILLGKQGEMRSVHGQVDDGSGGSNSRNMDDA